MKKSINDAKHKSFCKEKRDCYLSVDGKFYCYRVWDETGQHSIIHKFEVGKDLSRDVTLVLDELDHDMDLNDRYAMEQYDSAFDTKVAIYYANPYGSDVINPWEGIASGYGNPEDVLFAEPKPANPQIAKVRQIIDDKFTESQKDFFFDHFGQNIQLEEMRHMEAKHTGKLPTLSAMNNRKNKILAKVAKALGIEPIK